MEIVLSLLFWHDNKPSKCESKSYSKFVRSIFVIRSFVRFFCFLFFCKPNPPFQHPKIFLFVFFIHRQIFIVPIGVRSRNRFLLPAAPIPPSTAGHSNTESQTLRLFSTSPPQSSSTRYTCCTVCRRVCATRRRKHSSDLMGHDTKRSGRGRAVFLFVFFAVRRAAEAKWVIVQRCKHLHCKTTTLRHLSGHCALLI